MSTLAEIDRRLSRLERMVEQLCMQGSVSPAVDTVADETGKLLDDVRRIRAQGGDPVAYMKQVAREKMAAQRAARKSK